MANGLTGPDLGALLRELKAVDQKAATNLRRNLRNVAKVAAEDVKREVQESPPNDAPGTVGTRAAIAAGIGVRITSGANSKRQGVSITASGRALPANRKPMLLAYNKTSWRHPVFADAVNGDRDSRTSGFRALDAFRRATGRGPLKSWTWVEQQGNPYWRSTLSKHTDDVQRAIVAAVDEANAALLRAK